MESPIGPEQKYSQIRLWLPAISVVATLVISSHFSGKPASPGVVGFDKVAHLFVFGLIGTLLFRCVRIPFLNARRWLFAFAGAMLYAVADEVLQLFNPSRSFDVWDWVADGVGAMLAITLYRNWSWYRGLLEIRLWGRKKSSSF